MSIVLNGWVAVLPLVFSLPAVAQETGSIEVYGRILGEEGLQGIPFSTVVVRSTGKGTVTDDLGYFVISVPSDTSTLVISHLGYQARKVRLDSLKIQGALTIKLSEAIQYIQEVTVAVEKERIVRVPENKISTARISPELIAKLPNLGEVDVLRSFQLLPGVSATNETSAGLYVRGGTPDQNLILFDGMTIYHVDHFYGFFSAFNSNTIDDIELIKGGFPAEYGGRTSSVMEITGKPADLREVHGGGSLSLLSANAFLEVPLLRDRLSFQLAARRSYTDLIRTGLYNKIFNLYNEDNETGLQGGRAFSRQMQITHQPVFHFYDLNSKLTWKPDSLNTFALSFYNGQDKLDNSRDLQMPFNFSGGAGEDAGITDIAHWGNTGVSGQWTREWNCSFRSKAFLSYSNYYSYRDRGTNIDPGESSTVRARDNLIEDNNVRDFSFRIRNTWNAPENHTFGFGFEGTWNDIRYLLQLNDTLIPVDRKHNGLQLAVYARDRFRIGEKLILNGGIRVSWFGITGKFYPEPRLSMIWEPLENLKLKTAWGMYNQFHARIVREDVLQGSKDFWLLSDDEGIPVQSSVHYIAGAGYGKGNWYFDVEAFHKELNGLTEYSMRFTGLPGGRRRSRQEEYFFEGNGHADGIEMLVQKKYGLNTGWIAYTLSEVKHTFPDLNYGKSFHALHDQTHELKSVYSRRIGHWDLSAAFIYATGKPYTSPENVYELKLLDGSTFNYIHVSDKNAYRLPDYHRLDISASYNWKGQKTEQTVSLSIFNLYNRNNVWYKEFDIEEDRITVTDVTLLGITPNISFRINF